MVFGLYLVNAGMQFGFLSRLFGGILYSVFAWVFSYVLLGMYNIISCISYVFLLSDNSGAREMWR